MKKLIGTMLFLTLLSTTGFALLAPLEQSIREIQTLVNSPELRKNLESSETIQDIWKIGSRYVISTENRQMVVQVIYSPRTTPGPQEFKLTFFPAKPYGE